MASIDLNLDSTPAAELDGSGSSGGAEEASQTHHVIDLSSSVSPPPAANRSLPEALEPTEAALPGHVINFGDYQPPRSSHRTIRVGQTTQDVGVQTTLIDDALLAELPSVQQMQRHIRPSTVSEKARRASKVQLQHIRKRRSRVAPMEQNDLDLDEPSRLQNRCD